MDSLSQPALLDVAPKRRKPAMLFNPKEFKLVSLRECPTPAEMQLCDTPDKAAAYWREHVPGHPYFNRDVECFVVLLLNTRRKVQGHCLISTGTLDTILGHLPGASPEPRRNTSDRRSEVLRGGSGEAAALSAGTGEGVGGVAPQTFCCLTIRQRSGRNQAVIRLEPGGDQVVPRSGCASRLSAE
jgi:hypothetical protein